MRERTSDLCGPRLRPCEACGGVADYEAVPGSGGWVVARCTACGRQTRPSTCADNAAKDWNRRASDGARVVALSELWDLDFHMGDDQTDVAVWIEGQCGTLRAAVLSFGIDLGEPIVREVGMGRSFNWSKKDIRAEGRAYRIWDKRPTEAEREALPWILPWKDARELRADAKLREVLGDG